MAKKYTLDDLLGMKEEKVLALFEAGKIDDDDVQYYYDAIEDAKWMAEDFLKYEMPLYGGA